MIEIIDGVAHEYEWVDGEWVLKAGSPWNDEPRAEGEPIRDAEDGWR